MKELSENFYEMHWRDNTELCYVKRSEQGGFFSFFPDGRILPVLESTQDTDYVLVRNLVPATPTKIESYLTRAQDMIKFIHTGRGRLSKIEELPKLGELPYKGP